MTDADKKKWAVLQLQSKNKELGRIPKKDDFDVVTLSRIKAFLGPWPRALEQAELKEITHCNVPKQTRRQTSKTKGQKSTALSKGSLEKEKNNKKNREGENQ